MYWFGVRILIESDQGNFADEFPKTIVGKLVGLY